MTEIRKTKNRQKVLRRAGTSFREFEEKFPNQKSCLDQIMKYRLREIFSCPKCGKIVGFKKISKRNSYIAKCCTIRILSPLLQTPFYRSQISLVVWFRIILYFTNASMGISPKFISNHFDLQRRTAMRTCQLIRYHLLSIDNGICLGQNGRNVYVSETTIRSISRRGRKNGVRYRILMATDGVEFLSIPITSGKLAKSRRLLLDRLYPNARIVIQTDELKKKILNYYNSFKVKGHYIETTDDPYHQQFNELSVCVIALKRFILQSHYWVSEQHLDSYIGHFAFLYRRRHRGHEAFWDAVSNFPKFPKLS